MGQNRIRIRKKRIMDPDSNPWGQLIMDHLDPDPNTEYICSFGTYLAQAASVNDQNVATMTLRQYCQAERSYPNHIQCMTCKYNSQLS